MAITWWATDAGKTSRRGSPPRSCPASTTGTSTRTVARLRIFIVAPLSVFIALNTLPTSNRSLGNYQQGRLAPKPVIHGAVPIRNDPPLSVHHQVESVDPPLQPDPQ